MWTDNEAEMYFSSDTQFAKSSCFSDQKAKRIIKKLCNKNAHVCVDKAFSTY